MRRPTIPTKPSAPSGPRRLSTDGRVLLRPRLFVAGGGARDPCRHRRRRPDRGNDAYRPMAPSSSRTRATASISSTATRPDRRLADDLRRATHVVVSIPPDEAGDPVLRHHRADLEAAPNLEWIGYYSTVGVYGDFGGAVGRRGRRDAADQPAQQAAGRGRAAVARRSPPRAACRSRSSGSRASTGRAARPSTSCGRATPGGSSSRARCSTASMSRTSAGSRCWRRRRGSTGTFNLADDEPAPPQDLVTHAAAMIGVTPPPEVPFETARDVADGALVLFRQQAGLERADQSRRSASSCSIRPIARVSRRFSEEHG